MILVNRIRTGQHDMGEYKSSSGILFCSQGMYVTNNSIILSRYERDFVFVLIWCWATSGTWVRRMEKGLTEDEGCFPTLASWISRELDVWNNGSVFFRSYRHSPALKYCSFIHRFHPGKANKLSIGI